MIKTVWCITFYVSDLKKAKYFSVSAKDAQKSREST